MTPDKQRRNALKDFEIDSLDAMERLAYNVYVIEGYSKEETLQAMIDGFDGDYSQLSEGLAALANELDNIVNN